MRVSPPSIWLCTLLGGVFLLSTGCTTPRTRSRETPAALRQLSSADQRLALSGRIRNGFSQDAVYVAWGAPSRMNTFNVKGGSINYWLYSQTQHGVAGGYFGVSRGFYYHGRYIDPAAHLNGSGDFYVAPPYFRGFPPPETEVPYKKVVFEHEHVIDYESPHNDSAPN